MAGPLATIWAVYKTGSLPKKVEAPIWVVLFSATSLVIGLATYGYNITRVGGHYPALLISIERVVLEPNFDACCGLLRPTWNDVMFD